MSRRAVSKTASLVANSQEDEQSTRVENLTNILLLSKISNS